MADHYCSVTVSMGEGAMMALGDISIACTVKEIAERIKIRKNLDGLQNVFIGYEWNKEIIPLSEEISLADVKTFIIRVLSYRLGCVLATLNFHITVSSFRIRRPHRTTYVWA